MITEIGVDDYFRFRSNLPLVDVRSPGEFEKGHIPGAVNIPLFNNDERAHVGTVYVQQSKEKAIELGYEYVTPKLNYFIERSKEVSGGKAIVVHCWRGGMRSRSFAEHLHKNGFNEVYLVKKGYKAFRNYVLNFFEQPFILRILGGFTGSGKTYVLKELNQMGEQVIDLEGLANHKGSAFGAIGEKSQPTVEHFENCLFNELRNKNIQKPIWIEDESHNIGFVKIPMSFYKQIRQQTVFFMDVNRDERARHLVGEYSVFGDGMIKNSLQRITKKLGGQNVKEAMASLERNDYYEVAMIALKYYDKAYRKGVEDREPSKVFIVELPGVNHKSNAESIYKFVNHYEQG